MTMHEYTEKCKCGFILKAYHDQSKETLRSCEYEAEIEILCPKCNNKVIFIFPIN